MSNQDPTAQAFSSLYDKVLRVEEKLDYLISKVNDFEADAKKMGEMFSPDKLPELLTQILGGGF